MDAHDWDERYRAVTEPWGIDPAGTVATRIADLQPGTAIDLACGDGRHARWMAGQGWSVTAVDYSSVAIDLAAREAAAARAHAPKLVTHRARHTSPQ